MYFIVRANNLHLFQWHTSTYLAVRIGSKDRSITSIVVAFFLTNFFYFFVFTCFHDPQLIDRVPNELKKSWFLLHLKLWKLVNLPDMSLHPVYNFLENLFSWGANNHFVVVMILIIFWFVPRMG